MKLNRKLSHPATLLLAAVVAILTCAVVANAAGTLYTPHAALYAYNLAAGASGVVTVPIVNQPVLVMGTYTTSGGRGVGQISLLRTGAFPLFLEWVGLNSPRGASIAQGYSATPGTHMVYIDWYHLVDIEVHNASAIRVHNEADGTNTGFVKLIW
jgi:hypothetical protein